MVLALAIAVHAVLLLVYYLRTKIYMHCSGSKDILPTTRQSISTSSIDPQAVPTISMVFGHENKVFDISSEKNNNTYNLQKRVAH